MFSLGTGLASAQNTSAGEVRQRWGLENLRNGWCVEFLIEAATAKKQAPPGYQMVPADQVSDLHPGTSRLIADSPEYASWIPANMCAFYFDAILVGEHRYMEKKPDNSEALIWWGVAVTPVGGAPGAPTVYSTSLVATSDWRPKTEAEGVFIPAARVDLRAGKVPESTDDRYTINLDHKTLITWDGHLTQDSAVIAPAFARELTGPGSRNTFWRISLRLQADSSRLMAGSLRVQGKNEVAKALQASPIRMVGPMYIGGSGEMTFAR